VELDITRGDDTEELGAKLAGLCEFKSVIVSFEQIGPEMNWRGVFQIPKYLSTTD
jgi:hypothetical protein